MRIEQRNDTIAYLKSGVDVSIIGSSGSGRTTFLRDISSQLTDSEFTVRRVVGIEALRATPMAALYPLMDSDSSRTPIVPAVVDALSDLARHGRFVLIIDNIDALDDASLGAIQLAQSTSDFRIVSSQLKCRIRLDTTHSRRLRRAYQLKLRPLRLDELERVLIERADGPIDASTLSRIFGKSAGLPGLALGLFDVGRQEGRIVLSEGLWTARDHLWSTTLDRLVQRHLCRLSPELQDALAKISNARLMEIPLAQELVGAETLADLEQHGVVMFTPRDGRLVASVTPPLVKEYFRHTPLESMGEYSSDATPHKVPVAPPAPWAATPEPSFVRAVQEATNAKLEDAADRWREAPTGENVRSYVRALVCANAPRDEFTEVWNTPVEDPVEQIGVLVMRAHWVADTGQPGAALSLLTEAIPDAGSCEPLLQAAIVQLRLEHASFTDDVREVLPITPDLPEEFEWYVRTIRAYALVVAGEFTAARKELGDSVPSTECGDWPLRCMLHGLILIGMGEIREATHFAYDALNTALDELDPLRIHYLAYLTAMCNMVTGNNREVESLLETALAIGTEQAFSLMPMLGLLSMGAVCALRTGREDVADARLCQASQLGVSEGPLPSMTLGWPKAQRLVSRGREQEAVELVRKSSDRLWGRGGKWAAVHGYLIELELDPDPSRLDALSERLSSVEGKLVSALADVLRAVVGRNPDAVVAAVPALIDTDRPGFVVSAYASAVQLLRENGRVIDAERVSEIAEQYRSKLTPGTYDSARFRSTDTLLTPREQQIARLVSDGYSNQKIATQLVLSVRTVESHLHRIMRKMGVSNRRALASQMLARTN